MRLTNGARAWWTWSLVALVLMAIPAIAVGRGIGLSRTPAPPQAIVQTGTESIPYTVTYDTIADSYRLAIFNPFNALVVEDVVQIDDKPSPLSGTFPFVPGTGAPLGRYRAQLDFYAFPDQLETSAFVTFDVADALGTIRLVKFEDLNGNGVRDEGEPGVPGWIFNIINPQGNGSVVATGPDGSITIAGVPAGLWQVTEVMEPGWVPITPVSGPATIPANGVGEYAAANARPAPCAASSSSTRTATESSTPAKPATGAHRSPSAVAPARSPGRWSPPPTGATASRTSCPGPTR